MATFGGIDKFTGGQQMEVFCDDNGAFIRFINTDDDGNITPMDFGLDGVTPYTTVGDVVRCDCGLELKCGDAICASVERNGIVTFERVIPTSIYNECDGTYTPSQFLSPSTITPITDADTILPATNLAGGEFGGTFGTQNPGPTGARNLQNPPGAPYVYNAGFAAAPGSGNYAVFSGNPTAWHVAGNNNAALRGHTSGTDDDAYLIVNGAQAIGTFYTETIAVPANTDIRITFWYARWAPNPNNSSMGLNFQATATIGGAVLGTATSALLFDDPDWHQASAEFNTGANTSIDINLRNYTTHSGGNEITIDDIAIRLLDDPCENNRGGSCDAPTFVRTCSDANDVTPVESVVTNAGTTTAGRAQVSVLNSGAANGVLNGIAIIPGETRTFTAYANPNTNEFIRIGAIPYNATGTSFTISETP